jgi:hypothetical protein
MLCAAFPCIWIGTGFRFFGSLVMAKSNPSKEIELHSDAWARFERAADVVAKSPPQHRMKTGLKKKTAKRAKKPVKQVIR